jgi:arylsulfatase
MASRRPNVILILVDDMGFSDLGIMGSEIRTPNIDALGRGGALLTSMYNCARCCPTRAALLTGLYPHNAGIGHMGADLGTPAYQGYLRQDAVTIAEVLRLGGYRTLMAGKWHVGGDLWATRVAAWTLGSPRNPTPRQRGFDRYYGMIDGVAHYFSPHYVMQDDGPAEIDPSSFYFTDAITDRAIDMVQGAVGEGKPFFLYLAHAAPHWPLHAHEEDIARYEHAYRGGWDALRTARHEEMLARGVLQHRWAISPRDMAAPPWSDIKVQDWEASRMAVYAAMIDRMDQCVGRVVEALRRLGQLDDTLILFLSDNGGCAELMAEDGWAKFWPNRVADGRRIAMGNRPGLRPGGPLTFMSYDLPWANVSNAPFRLFKHWVHEGGISTPLVAHWPRRIKAGTIAHTPAHVIDLMPTILAAAGVQSPTESGVGPLQSMNGESLLPLLEGRHEWERSQPIFWEHEGNAAVRHGKWKLVRRFGSDWELYDMEADRTELNDLAFRNQPMRDRLVHEWEGWAASVGVLDWAVAGKRLRAAWEMANEHG